MTPSEFEQRVAFETFVGDCAARFATRADSEPPEPAIVRALTELLPIARADGAALLGGTPSDGGLGWETCVAQGIETPLRARNFAALFPWQFHALCAGQPVVVRSLDDYPREADADRRAAKTAGMPAQLAVPARDGQGSPHALILLARAPRAWPDYYLPRLTLLAALFVNALDRKRASDTREQLAGGNTDLLESVRAIVWRADARTFQTTFVSREAEAILGYPVESWLRVPGFWTSHIHPDDREWVIAFSGRATREHRKHDFEYRMIVADGRTVWLRNIVNVLVEGGEAAELVGVTVDITERKLAEIEADRLRHQFTQALRVTSLGELAVTLAHELNQPLGAIVSNAEAAQVFLSRTPPARDRVLPILADIVQDARRAGDVLHRARRRLQNQPIELLPLDVARTIAEVVALSRELALSRRVDVASHVAPGLPRPAADAVQIQQVLLNLVFNAMDAVAVRPEGRRQVSIDAAARDGWVELTVTDSGEGIPPEQLPRVFDPFFTTKSGGMGMGLAICRSIAEAHGGDIALENNAGGGARVRVRLPAGG